MREREMGDNVGESKRETVKEREREGKERERERNTRRV